MGAPGRNAALQMLERFLEIANCQLPIANFQLLDT